MQRSGVTRKLDDVGRIVIPKEIRRYLKLEEGSSLEIGINEIGEVVLSSISNRNSIAHIANYIGDRLQVLLNKSVVFVECNKVIASYGTSNLTNIDKWVIDKLNTSNQYIANINKTAKSIHINEFISLSDGYVIITPISKNDIVIGGIIVWGENLMDYETQLLQMIAKLCVMECV